MPSLYRLKKINPLPSKSKSALGTFVPMLPYLLLLLFGCGTSKTAYYNDDAINWESRTTPTDREIEHTLFLVGDAGEIDDKESKTNYVISAMRKQVEAAGKASSIVFLGDNIYPKGLPKKDDPIREEAEQIISNQLDLAGACKGKSYFIPGNHDWNKMKKGGRKAVLRQEEFVESYFNDNKSKKKKVHLYPGNACGDPKVQKINSDLVFVFIDTQWWLQDWDEEKNINEKCEIKTRGDLLKRMEEIFLEHKNDEIVVLMHHPIKTNGTHGGNFSVAHHLFPIHEYKNLWIPLPILGSFLPIYRSVSGHPQDVTNAHNQELMYGLRDMAQNLRINVLFASGHDHGLQHFDHDKLQYIVSGAGGKYSYVRAGSEANYARSARGFARVDFYEEFEAWLEIYTVPEGGGEPVLEYRTQLREPRPGTVDPHKEYPPLTKKDTTLAANSNFGAGPFKRFILGDQYREMWTTPVKMPIIDLEITLGGLTPIKKGGGMASNSLRMSVEDGRHYILRSINKDYRKTVPDQFSNLRLINIMKDQNSASHPYGALVIPALSKAAGIYYSTPKLVYLQHQPALANYNELFPEEVYLLEERPSGDGWQDFEQFGNSENIVGYVDLLEILRTGKKHFVDQEWTLKSRLFDLLIHDWDRHDDQWRWATFDTEEGTLYRPIPRDRDQAFYKFRGVLPSLVATFLVKKFKGMKHEVKDVKNLSFNAQHFDRHFLNQLEWSDWETAIAEMQANMSDDAIDAALALLPKEVRAGHAEEVAEKLKSRRDQMPKYAKKLYRFLWKEIDIPGTDNDDIFEVKHSQDGSTRVQVFVHRKGKKKDDIARYDRTFHPKETKEIRLYGLRGEDKFNITGIGKGIRVRVIGGEDKDKVENESRFGKVIAYDNPKGLKIEKGDKGKIKDRRADGIEVNEYDRKEFKYNTSLPIVNLGFTPDDGFWIGGGINWTTQGWRKSPYKSKQSISASFAPGSRNTLQFAYKAHFPKILGRVDFSPNVNYSNPEYRNYFGTGNESVINTNISTPFNWVRMNSAEVAPLFGISSENGSRHLKFGPTFESYRIQNSPGRISQVFGVFNDNDFERHSFVGGLIDADFEFLDNKIDPKNGFSYHAQVKYLRSLGEPEGETRDLVTFDTHFNFYLTLLTRPHLVMANSVGYEKVWGEPEFYQFSQLGNNSNLRGFRNERFQGQSSFYHNVDFRLHLFDWENDILPMDVGLLGGMDNGRVWFDGEESTDWHRSYTAGLWMNVLDILVLQPHISFTDEEGNAFSLKMGFNF